MNPTTLSPAEYHAVLRSDFASFIERSFYELNPGTEFIEGQYIKLLAARLEDVSRGETKRLIVNLPPRSLKSHAASVAFPAWLLGHNPAAQIICASYGQELADKHARDCRTLMGSDFYRKLFPQTLLSSARPSVNDFTTTAQGGRRATSVGGALTGLGADVIILDDILKPEDAFSETRRRGANDWYFSTLLSRLNSKEHGRIIIVMQRLHQEDLVGEVMARETWELLSLPAIAEEDECHQFNCSFGEDVFTRRAGEALHPERDSAETYRGIQESVGEYVFQSQYQQNPTSRDGGYVKKDWLRYYDPDKIPQEYDWVLQSWDTACKVSVANDYSVCTTWKLIGGNFYLFDVFRKRLTFPQLKQAVIEQHTRHQPWTVLIEDQASGTSLIQQLVSENVCGVEGYRPAPGSDKRTRFEAQSTKFESGRVYLPTQAPWLDEYVREITGFPGSKYDDQVDSTSQALEILTARAQEEAWFDGLRRYDRSRYPRESC